MSIIKNLRFSTGAGLGLVILLTAFVAFDNVRGQVRRPQPKPAIITRFFSDSSFQCMCGIEWRKCDGSVVNTGCVTLFSTTEEVSCNFIPEEPVLCF